MSRYCWCHRFPLDCCSFSRRSIRQSRRALIEKLILSPLVDRRTHTLSCSRRFCSAAKENTRTVSDWTPKKWGRIWIQMFSLFAGEWVMGRDYRAIGAECAATDTQHESVFGSTHCRRYGGRSRSLPTSLWLNCLTCSRVVEFSIFIFKYDAVDDLKNVFLLHFTISKAQREENHEKNTPVAVDCETKRDVETNGK